MRFIRVLLLLVIILGTGCATRPGVRYSQKEVFDVLEVVLRHRLEKMPLPRHSRCYVFIENTGVASAPFAGRFPEYQMTVKRDSPGDPPPPRWYGLQLGQTTLNDAWVLLRDAAGWMGYHLHRKDGGGWSFLRSGRF